MHRTATATPFLLAALALAPACSSSPNVDLGANPDAGVEPYALVLDMLPAEVVDVDLLFVIDDSGSMAEEQAAIAAWAEDALFGVLELDADTLLNLHIGVVSTDMGVGTWPISTCEGGGDGGALNDVPADDTCALPTDRWLSDVDDGAGGRATNYSGSLTDAFSCMARLGIGGCGYEQPLAAMRAALTNPVNDGFLRDDALLAVIIVSDEDDCSVADTAMFDTNQSELDDPLGPLTSFRCFEFGVVCDDDDPRTVGDKDDCEPRDDSPYVAQVDEYVDFLAGLKDDPSMVVVAGIFGDPDDVGVELDDNGNPRLGASCSSAGGLAYPGVRLQAFLDGFPARSRFASICDDDLGGPLADAAMRIRDTALRSPCLYGSLRDTADAAGMQPSCRVFDQRRLTDGTVERSELRACSDAGDGACFELAAAPDTCAHTASQLAVSVTRSDEPAADAHLVVECLTD